MEPAAPTLRPPRPDEAAALAELGAATFTATFGHLYPAADLAAFLAEHRSPAAIARAMATPGVRYLVADAGAAGLVGYAQVGPLTLPVTPPGPAGELRQLYLRAGWHGSGLAASLMAWALGELRAVGAEHAYLGVWSDNERARRFYARYGFEPCGSYVFQVGTTADAELIMRAPLRPEAR